MQILPGYGGIEYVVQTDAGSFPGRGVWCLSVCLFPRATSQVIALAQTFGFLVWFGCAKTRGYVFWSVVWLDVVLK